MGSGGCITGGMSQSRSDHRSLSPGSVRGGGGGGGGGRLSGASPSSNHSKTDEGEAPDKRKTNYD